MKNLKFRSIRSHMVIFSYFTFDKITNIKRISLIVLNHWSFIIIYIYYLVLLKNGLNF